MMTSDAFEGPSPRDNQRLLESVRNRIGEVTRVIVQGRNQGQKQKTHSEFENRIRGSVMK